MKNGQGEEYPGDRSANGIAVRGVSLGGAFLLLNYTIHKKHTYESKERCICTVQRLEYNEDEYLAKALSLKGWTFWARSNIETD
ncbi:hypothetical protein KDC22_23915 [Paenibacillus tritici]|uniref:hypothetical protein n=1 Tax=Paenibacillus tritici TaxID=1873425 RepID=UPI001BA43C26|nr:hypothetical protein [Paenibacillus tritici]QUL53416.1 hypothetical protein KDC22_23915 [Paenibacillus tritici]